MKSCFDILHEKTIPRTKKGIVRFRLIQNVTLDARVVGSPAEQTIKPVPAYIPGNYDFVDPNNMADPKVPDTLKRKFRLSNEVSTTLKPDPKTGEMVEVPLVESIYFANGVYSVDPVQQRSTFMFLMLHPRNASNKYRDKSKLPLFEVETFNRKGSFSEQLAKLDLERFARDHIRLEMNYDERRKLAASINAAKKKKIFKVDGAQPDEIAVSLLEYARTDPRTILETSLNPRAVTKLLVSDARTADLLTLDITKGWLYKQEKNPRVVLTQQDKKDPIEPLIDYLLDGEGAKLAEKIKQELLPSDQNWID